MSATPQRGSTRTASVAGIVIDGTSGLPLPAVEVFLGSARRSSTEPQATTDSSGRFSIDGVVAGSYPLEARKSGYLLGGLGRLSPSAQVTERLALSQGERRSGIVVRLWREGAISGRVRSLSGDPVARATVGVMRLLVRCDDELLTLAASTETDDRGAYRFDGLAPGRYKVAVRAWPVSAGRTRLQVTTYFPDSVSPARAPAIELQPGAEQFGIDIVPASGRLSVEGRLDGLDVRSNRQRVVDLLDAEAGTTSPWPTAQAEVAADGTFRFRDVPRGAYMVRSLELPSAAGSGVRQFGSGAYTWDPSLLRRQSTDTPRSSFWAQASILVEDQDLAVRLAFAEGHVIAGRVTTGGDAQKDAALMPAMAVVVTRADGGVLGAFPAARPDTEGYFRTVGLPPGRYHLAPVVLASGAGSAAVVALNAIRLGTRDITGSPISLDSTDVADLSIELTNRGPTLQGVVESPEIERFGAQVYVFPTDAREWAECGFGTLPKFRVAPVDTGGRFQVLGLPPGDYYVAAGLGAEDSWTRREFLRSLAALATRTKLASGEARVLTLRARAVR